MIFVASMFVSMHLASPSISDGMRETSCSSTFFAMALIRLRWFKVRWKSPMA